MVHMGQSERFEMATYSESALFSEYFGLYLKVLAIIVSEL